MVGTFVNAAAIIAGSLMGIFLKKGIPERVKNTVVQGIGLSILLIGLQMGLQTKNVLVVIFSLVLGGLFGELIDIEGFLSRLGKRFELIFRAGGGFTRAFVSASLIYCVGAMAILGSIEDGLNGNPRILFAKSLLDGTTAIIFSSSMGIGVIFSAVPVFLYQGSITLLAPYLKEFLSASAIAEITAVGGLLILAIGLNILGVKEIKVGNLLPAIFFAPFLNLLFTLLSQIYH